ncbi:olfactory receptor 2G3-like [Bombina bombina]|uniref:olfactory receptor 2G3-like n=1 Tax=Bombina bombina TaxID=8345 RepID=UPI00235A75B6|nr:olfactory receptor 2G3-like [Bombina bombina]
MRNHSSVVEFILLGLSSHPMTQIVLFVVFASFYIMSLIGNIVIIFISKMDSQLHTPMYFFLSNLSFLDIWHTSTIVPNMLVNFLSVKKSISFAGCITQMCIHLSLGGTECYLLMVMAYDRYAAICCPLHYTRIMHPTLCIKMATGSWFGGLMNSLIHTLFALRLPFCGPNVINHFFCEVPVLLELACMDASLNKTVIFFCAILVVMIPFFLILMTYVYIITSILKISSSVGKKAFSTCASHVTVVTLFYGTIIFMYMRPGASHVHKQDKMAALFYSVVAPMLNPLIYTLRNKDVKEALKRMLWRVGRLVKEGGLAEVKRDGADLGGRVEFLEEKAESQASDIDLLTRKINAQESHITFLQTKLEDLDNRGRRQNRGIPENITHDNLHPGDFQNPVERPLTTRTSIR